MYKILKDNQIVKQTYKIYEFVYKSDYTTSFRNIYAVRARQANAWSNNNASDNFGPHVDEESTLEELYIEEDYRDLIDKSLDTKSHARDSLSGSTSENRLFANELSLFL